MNNDNHRKKWGLGFLLGVVIAILLRKDEWLYLLEKLIEHL